MNDNKRALVLSGGGGRGAYQIGVLTYLESIAWKPDVLVGTSIGAVNACALGSGVSITALRERWLDMETEDFQKMRADDVFVDNLFRRRTHVFDTDPLLSTITGNSRKWQGRAWYDADILNDAASSYDVWITAVDFATHALVYFHNHSAEGITAKMVQASCSIPLWYEPTTIQGRTYVDGGTIANTPFRQALDLGAEEIVVVLMSPWRGNAAPKWHNSRELEMQSDELLKIPQALWSSFEPALDMLLDEIVWKDYQWLLEELNAGKHPQLRWLRFVAPSVALPVGNMTIYQRDNHIRLFRQGEQDARELLRDVLGAEAHTLPARGRNRAR